MSGRRNSDALRKITEQQCRRCGDLVYAGLSDDVLALLVYVDRDPIGPGRELREYLADRTTYTLDQSGRLWDRSRWALARTPVPRLPVHRQHPCYREARP